MSLRWRIALAMAAVAVTATVLIGTASYRETRGRLLAEVDRSLVALDEAIAVRRLDLDAPIPSEGPLAGLYVQVIRADGGIRQSTFPVTIPVTDTDVGVAGRPRVSTFRTVETEAGDFRVRTVGLGRGAVQVGRSLDETDRVLRGLRMRTLLWVVLVAVAAIAAGLWIAGRVTRSLRALTAAAEHVGATGRLDVSVGEGSDDEVGRLSRAFDGMLGALRRSRDQQQRLVQDAGHELRTPLTSLRTNLDTLRRHPGLDDNQRQAIVDDLHAETEELTHLVDEIVTVASGEAALEPLEEFDLGALVGEVADRYARRTDRAISVDAAPGVVRAQRSAIQRAVSSLLDNARKFDTTGGPIEVTVADGEVRVADRGPGIPADELDAVFDRFHRTESARSQPGSGLGLAIVRDVAHRHGGDAFAEARPGGGVVVGFRLDPSPPARG